MMKILHIIPSITTLRGGSNVACINMVKALRIAGIDAEIVTTNDNVNTVLDVPVNKWIEYDQELPVLFFPKIYIGIKFISEYTLALDYHNWLWNNIENYDIVHIHSFFSYLCTLGAIIARLKKVKYIISPHGQLDSWVIKQKKIKKMVYYTLLEQQNLENASAIYCTTNQEAQDVKIFGIKSPTFILPIGVTPLVDLPDAKIKIHTIYNIALNIPIILFMSRFHPKKHMELLLYAAHNLAKRHNFHLILAGSGNLEYEQYIFNLVLSLNLNELTTFSGFVQGEDKTLLLQGADIFVLPSYGENFAITVAEAMAYDLPVIITPEVQISPEIEANKTGLVVSGELEAWVQAIEKLLMSEKLRAEMGENSRLLARTKYDWNTIAKKLSIVYQAIINNKLVDSL
ncbi:MAG: glycosyltransferase [Microcystis sp. LE19-12.2C]|nr:glycosyltransferase [Microcystis sp. LE19-12.2C]